MDPTGNFYSATAVNGATAPAVAKSSASGTQLWITHISGSSQITWADLILDSSGNAFAAGTESTSSGGASDISVLKFLSSTGAIVFRTCYNGHADGSGEDKAAGLVLNSIPEIYVTGTSTNPDVVPGGQTDIVTIKYGTRGQLLWAERYDGPVHGNDSAVATGIAGNDLIVTGESLGSDPANDWVTLDYVQDPLVLSPSSLAFGSQAVGTQSAFRNVTVTNKAEVTVDITDISVSTGFHQASNCPPTLAAGASCTIQVSFTPASAGAKSGDLTVKDDWQGSLVHPLMVSLFGTGTD